MRSLFCEIGTNLRYILVHSVHFGKPIIVRLEAEWAKSSSSQLPSVPSVPTQVFRIQSSASFALVLYHCALYKQRYMFTMMEVKNIKYRYKYRLFGSLKFGSL